MKSFILGLIACPFLLFGFHLPTKEIAIPFMGLFEKDEKDISQIDKPATVRVLLGKALPGALIETKGSYNIYNPNTAKLVQANASDKRFFLYPSTKGISWGTTFNSLQAVRFVPLEPSASILVNGIQYKGCVEAHDVDGKINLINELDVENYLRSVLSTSFLDETNHEVLDAITIVARTHAYHAIDRNSNLFWDVDAKDVSYLGHGLILQNPSVDESVESTRFVVMTYKQNPFPATWTKNSAGKTADYGTIFRKQLTGPEGVLAPFAAKERNNNSWTVSIDRSTLASLLDLETIRSIELLQDKYSGKVYSVRFSDGANETDLSFFDLQKAVGEKLKSNDFTIEDKQGLISFTGYGEGAGTGLCLYSAQMMAQRGEKAQNILSAFFPQTKLQNLRAYPNNSNAMGEDSHVAHNNP